MDRYKGSFNWYGELITLWTHASSESKAKSNLLRQLSKKVDISYSYMIRYFNGNIDNLKIERN